MLTTHDLLLGHSHGYAFSSNNPWLWLTPFFFYYSRYTIAPNAAMATVHRPPEIVIDRSPALGFPEADALGLEVAPDAPPAVPLDCWALGLEFAPVSLAVPLSAGDLGVAVADAWLLAGSLGKVVGPGAGAGLAATDPVSFSTLQKLVAADGAWNPGQYLW